MYIHKQYNEKKGKMQQYDSLMRILLHTRETVEHIHLTLLVEVMKRDRYLQRL